MQAVRQIVDSDKLAMFVDMPESMLHSKVEVIVFPLAEITSDSARSDFKNTIREIQKQSIANRTSNMTMEEIDAEIKLARQEKRNAKSGF